MNRIVPRRLFDWWAAPRVNLYAAISAGICALWGPLHGGANQAVVEMLQQIHDSGGDPAPLSQGPRTENDPFRLDGFWSQGLQDL